MLLTKIKKYNSTLFISDLIYKKNAYINTNIIFFCPQLSEAVDAAKKELLNEKEISEKSQKELENDLVATKHRWAIC